MSTRCRERARPALAQQCAKHFLIVERAITHLRECGMTVLDAITEAVRVRLQPIMISMVTAMAGLSPLVFNSGGETELYRGLGAIVLFGLLFSTLVILTFMPALLKLVLSGVQLVKPRRIDAQTPEQPQQSSRRDNHGGPKPTARIKRQLPPGKDSDISTRL